MKRAHITLNGTPLCTAGFHTRNNGVWCEYASIKQAKDAAKLLDTPRKVRVVVGECPAYTSN